MKLKIFAWLLLADRLNTRKMLQRRHYNVRNDVNCALCTLAVEETVEHLYFRLFSVACWASVSMSWSAGGDRLCLVHSGRQGWSCPLFMEIFVMVAWSIWKEQITKSPKGSFPPIAPGLQDSRLKRLPAVIS